MGDALAEHRAQRSTAGGARAGGAEDRKRASGACAGRPAERRDAARDAAVNWCASLFRDRGVERRASPRLNVRRRHRSSGRGWRSRSVEVKLRAPCEFNLVTQPCARCHYRNWAFRASPHAFGVLSNECSARRRDDGERRRAETQRRRNLGPSQRPCRAADESLPSPACLHHFGSCCPIV